MWTSNVNLFLLVISSAFLIAQIFVKQKQTAHLIFAVFCGSVAMIALKKLTGEQIGAYQYLIGMATCATCNAYWLLSRSLFRSTGAITLPHVLMAMAIAMLIMAKQGYLFVSSALGITPDNLLAHNLLGDLTGLLSSCIIVLTMWEGFRGYRAASTQQQAQRRFFIITIVSAVAISTILNNIFADNPTLHQWSISLVTLVVLINTQLLLYWRFKPVVEPQAMVVKRHFQQQPEKPVNQHSDQPVSVAEKQFAKVIQTLLLDEQRFLQASLKVADIARELKVPEYRISKTLRSQLDAKNFNDFINKLRIEHACGLLSDPGKQHWTILVVSLESGFASVGPFTRAFKAITGSTPNQYRQSHLNKLAPNTSKWRTA
ncbi:response regulator transcription factor [Arsukibacterium sp.]|uniref:helix-turn-helix domain-containing protein n=1 Tax=Arsukibacterium sp. TaxID=1977258 RepID=UPI001BD49E1F|nr:response regulator transcription factor [Arsukibacterium sp.]